jgi:DNA-binding NtrC family response regulator
MRVPLIAVIEDDAAILDLHDIVLRDAGYHVVGYTQAQGADRFVLRALPDLIILDLWLEQPDSGEAVLAALEKHPATRRIPVIVCSAHAPGVHRLEEQLRAKGYRVVDKPFNPDDLVRCVRCSLESRGGGVVPAA